MIAGSIGLVVSRRGLLRSEHRLESLLSRESIFLVQNLVLVAVCFVVFWGTFFPLISEAVTGTKASVGPPWFDRYITTLGILLVALTGIGPAIAWRRGTTANLRRNFALPVVCGVGCVVALIAAGVTGSTGALALFACAAFAVATAAQEFWRGTRARRAAAGEVAPRALVALVRRNRRRYGGYIVHVGFAVILVGIAASTAFQHARDVRLTPGQTAHVGGYDVRYVRPVADQGAGKIGTGALVAVSRNGHPVGTLRTLHDYYSSHAPFADGLVGEFFAGDPETEVGLQAGLRRDLWVAIRPDIDAVQARARAADRALPRGTPRQIAGAVQRDLRGIVADYLAHPGAATFRVIVDPLVSWIWIGGMILALGALIALWPGGPGRRGRRRSEPMPAAAPAAARSGEQGRQGRELAPV
jgi:cytochrome c-type biogenesis protein CcmF